MGDCDLVIVGVVVGVFDGVVGFVGVSGLRDDFGNAVTEYEPSVDGIEIKDGVVSS